jgi:heme/copper-type cytochrome/quinol oxidase subunit 2
MRLRLISISALFFFATAVFAKDVYLSIGGSVGVFRTDMRIFNPSSTKDIQVQAYYLPRGNTDNSAVQPMTITVPKRQMLLYDDVVSSLFHAGDIGAIRLKSDDDFVATQRIYAQSSALPACNVQAGTLGQFVPGLDTSAEKKQGVLIQLKASDKFRTNIGLVNPNTTSVNVTWRLYDKNNALVGSVKTISYAPFGVQGPTSLAAFADNVPINADLSDAWLSFVSDQPILAYASVIDNATTDPTFIPMSEDTGAPLQQQSNTFTVVAHQWAFDVSPALTGLKVGDSVTFRINATDAPHGFILVDPDNNVLIPGFTMIAGAPAVEKTFTIPKQGTYSFACFNPSCGTGHYSMVGGFDVGTPTDPGGPHY